MRKKRPSEGDQGSGKKDPRRGIRRGIRPMLGDPEHGIAPGMAFEDVPDDWRCPVCGIAKDAFFAIVETVGRT